MSVKERAGTFKNPLIKETFKLITKESVLSVLENSCDYYLKKEKEYKESRLKARKEILKYLAIVEMAHVDKLYWDNVLTLNAYLPTPVLCGQEAYEAIKERLSTINYGG